MARRDPRRASDGAAGRRASCGFALASTGVPSMNMVATSGANRMQYERGSYESAGPSTTPWCVMVLAHNEERRIKACLDSVFHGEPGHGVDVYVMANGCTDRTEQLVRDYRSHHPTVHLVSIAMGDKCNAWNVFVHETIPKMCPGKSIYYFMDGDAQLVPGSLT